MEPLNRTEIDYLIMLVRLDIRAIERSVSFDEDEDKIRDELIHDNERIINKLVNIAKH